MDEPAVDHKRDKRPMPYGVRWLWRAVRMAVSWPGGLGALLFAILVAVFDTALSQAPERVGKPMTLDEILQLVVVVALAVGVVFLGSLILAPWRMERDVKEAFGDTVRSLHERLADAGSQAAAQITEAEGQMKIEFSSDAPAGLVRETFRGVRSLRSKREVRTVRSEPAKSSVRISHANDV